MKMLATLLLMLAISAFAQDLKPITRDANIRKGVQYHLVNLGGPNEHLWIVMVNDLEIWAEFSRQGPKKVERKTGFGDVLTLLHDDGYGCKTYFLDRTSRAETDIILRFEHAANSLWHPERR